MKNLFTGMTKPLIAAALLLAGNAGANNEYRLFFNDGTGNGFNNRALLFATDGNNWSLGIDEYYYYGADVSKVDSVTLLSTTAVKMTALDIRDTALLVDSTISVKAFRTPSNATDLLFWSIGDTTVLKMTEDANTMTTDWASLTGLKAGKTKLYVKSSLTGLRDSATVTVSAPKAATGIRIGALSSNALRAGSARALSVTLTPADANTAVVWSVSDTTKGVTVSGDSLRYSGYPNVAVKDSVWVVAATDGGIRDSVKAYLYGIGLRVWDGRTEAADASHLFLRDWDDGTAGTLQGDSTAPTILLDAGDAATLGEIDLGYVYGPTGSTDGRDDATEDGECRSTDTTVMKLATCGDGGLDPIFTWPGKTFTVPATLTPSVADTSSLTWTVQGASERNSQLYTIYHSGSLDWYTLVNDRYPGLVDDRLFVDTLVAACGNGSRDSVVVASRLVMRGSWGGSDFSEKLNQDPTQSNVSWGRSDTKFYIRAYYAANKEQFDYPIIVVPDMYFTKIPTSEYTVTSDDASVTVAKAADGVTYELTRTEFSTLKEVTLTYIFGVQTFTEIVTLTK